MKKQLALLAALSLACGTPAVYSGLPVSGFAAVAQAQKATGTIVDETGEPLAGVSVIVKGKAGGVTTDLNGNFSLSAKPGDTIVFSYVGYAPAEVKYTGSPVNIALKPSATNLDEVVVTALGIKKDKKSLGYAIDDMSADEIARNKTANPLNSLAGKIAGVNITQSSGAAGAGAQIILRGATSASENRDNQPLFVVDGIIYDNSSSVGGNSAFDGSTSGSTTSSNRVMDINPEDIENMSILKGPAAAALYGSRAANGVVLITTKKGKTGSVEVNLSAKYITSWVKDVPKSQTRFKRGKLQETYDADKKYTGYQYDGTNIWSSWGNEYGANDHIYSNNTDDFFKNGGIWDTNISVAGGTETGNFYLSGSYFNQDGVVRNTGYNKATFRFNGEQKWKIFTFGANTAYSEARTDKTLTSGGLYGSGGQGALQRIYSFGTTDDMSHYINEDGTRYKLFPTMSEVDELANPYWIINKDKIHDKTTRFTGSFNIRADITDWWWVNFRMGIDNYTTNNDKLIAPGGVVKSEWLEGMMSKNTTRYNYLNTNFMMNFNKTFGDFNMNLMVGTSTDKTDNRITGEMAYRFIIPEFYSISNVAPEDLNVREVISRKRLVGVYGEFRADWKNTLFVTVTGRNDWTSTLPKANRSYFYPSYSGAIVFTQFLQEHGILEADDFLTFGKIRASWAKVGKDTSPYETATALWPVTTYPNGMLGLGNDWTRGNPYLKPEMTKSTEIGLELRFIQNRLKLDYAYYTNDSYNQINSPRGAQSTGYIFCSQNVGNVLNKGMELSISGTPIQTRDWTWETGINIAGNRGRLEGLNEGTDALYVTDVQYGTARAGSFNDGHFMAIAGNKWKRVEDKESPYYGQVILKDNGMPDYATTLLEVGNREPKFSGGWNNTLTYKNWSFNMLWDFTVGGSVYNGTKYYMTQNGTSEFSADFRQRPLTISGVKIDPDTKAYVPYTQTYEPNEVYNYGGVETLGYNIIKDYYTSYYPYETANYITKVNSLRLRSISLTYELPRNLLAKSKVFKRALVTASATNLLLFTNYDGDPEAAASGAGAGGSSSVGFDYCGVPSTASFAFGVNLTF